MFNAVIAGNIGKDAATRNAGQSTVTSWSVAVEQRGKEGKTTTWVDCSLWGTRGEKLAGYLTKGGKVCVSGELSTRQHEGKTYLQINVADVTLMGGGGERQEREPQRQQSQGYGGNDSADSDQIPF